MIFLNGNERFTAFFLRKKFFLRLKEKDLKVLNNYKRKKIFNNFIYICVGDHETIKLVVVNSYSKSHTNTNYDVWSKGK